MRLKRYQRMALTTCTDSSFNFTYMMLNLAGEVGELASKVAKAIRKEEAVIDDNHLSTEKGGDMMSDEEIRELQLEAGDILWQLSGLCSVMGWELADIAKMNLDKLAARKKNGTIIGSGDGVTKEERF